MCDFTHLHCHSEYSTLDGMGKVRELFETAKSLGQNALAISDHGSMSGLWEAQCVADSLDMKAIHGCEFYYERTFDGKNGHQVILAKNNVGLENMFKMHQWASKENFYKKPRINWEVLKEHAEGLVVTTSCLGSDFNQYIMAGEIDKARALARQFQEVFGEDFYIEIQPNQIAEQYLCNKTGIRIAKELSIQLVATNDVHYVFEDDCFPHEVLLAMQMKTKMSNPKRFKFSTDDFWLKSEEEMYETFGSLDKEKVQEAIHNTRKIADKCHARIEKGHYLPSFYDVPEGETERTLLAQAIMKGAKERQLNKDTDFMKALQYELDVIDRNGYSGYFLIVQDYVTSAKERGELVGDGRGSGAGSKVAYTTRITEIPPHEYDLLFERFLADGREPDFDVDFSDQQAVFRDLQGKYGLGSVSRIVAYGTMSPKSVVRKVMGAFDHPTHIINELSKMVPDGMYTIQEAMEQEPKLKEYRLKYRIEFDVMERLQNVISHLSQHAGGVLIYPDLGKHLPLAWDKTNEIYVSGFDMDMLHDLGFFKFDCLGLQTLPILYGAIQSIRTIEPDFDITKIDLEDQAVYDMLCKGDVSGVFQLANQSGKVMQQQPRSFRDLIAINALIRPGTGDWDEYLARRQGKEWSVHPDRLHYLAETEGLITYQEQFLLDAHHLAGWDIAYADKHLRKNKDIRNDTELRNKFIHDVVQKGYQEQLAVDVWTEIEDSVAGGYSFNKSHSASYAMLSYQTAYLKCHYPIHFYASQMSGTKTDGDGQNEIAMYMAECKTRGIQILPPNINNSTDRFVVVPSGIAYRITTIKHVGESAIQHINELRPITSFNDFLQRRDKSVAKKNVVTNLIKAGAFDFDNPNRAELLWQFDMTGRTKTQIKNGYECPTYAYDDKIKMEWEKEVLGMYLSQHPMEKYGFQPLDSFKDGQNALQGGEVVTVYEFHPQKNPQKPKMAFITLNTLFGTVKVVVFARQWSDEVIRFACKEGNLLLIKGTRSGRDILLNEVEVLE